MEEMTYYKSQTSSNQRSRLGHGSLLSKQAYVFYIEGKLMQAGKPSALCHD